MIAALDQPSATGLLSQWTIQPLALAAVVVLAAWYARGVRRLERPWPRGRSTTFAVGLLLLIWTSSGPAEVYADSLYWVWTAQTLMLWLGVPIVLLWGHPLQLAQALSGPGGSIDRVLRSKPARTVSNPLIGPALVPILSFVFFFGPLPGWAIGSAPIGWLLQAAVVVVGALMVLPLVGLDDDVSSLAVGFSLAIGSIELVIDAVPGIVLRLHTGLVTTWFDHAAQHPWTPKALRDQQLAGNILWTVAELIDLPFLFLVYRRWLRADARDAANVDAVLEAERWARRAITLPDEGADEAPVPDTSADRDVPWWVNDPAMQKRLRRLE